MSYNRGKKVKSKKVSIDDCVVDNRREWFQTQPQQFDFNGDYEDWYIVRTWCIDNTEKLKKIKSPLEGGSIYEFVKYSSDNFSDYDVNGGVEEVREGVRNIWNNIPYEGYESPYMVLVDKCLPLKDVLRKKWVRTLLKEPKKVINHSTMNSLELMTRELSEWKMNSMWEGGEPQFYKD
jgi:hypothetical protein